ncbi:hypothetical protein [Streptomyces sp. NBC_01497]|uniref:hypothetical protein n=1 Tax=Streptomyces sp. NBC_01497 TaxID=2903885 RepID=UPI002E2F96D9|nr:hypothetical protein [Streptomyces sp. NBC_01497]
MDADDPAYRVPTGRPDLLEELHRKLPGVDDRIRQLPVPADPTEYEQIADTVYEVFVVARNLVARRRSTGCAHHPNGPVDPLAPTGWGHCLLCNSRRRVGRPDVRAAEPEPPRTWEVPQAPYDHKVLVLTMRRINEALADLHLRSADDAFVRLADLVHSAFIVARELSRPRAGSGCPRHPGAPVDEDAPGGPRCMFCQGRERLHRSGPPVVAVRPSRPAPQYHRRRSWPKDPDAEPGGHDADPGGHQEQRP